MLSPCTTRQAASHRCAESLLLLDANISAVLVRVRQATSLRGLRDALRELQASAFAPALARWVEDGSPIVAYLFAVHNWCVGVLRVARAGGALRWRPSEHALAASSSAYILDVVEPSFSHLRELCTDAKLRGALWPCLARPMVRPEPQPTTRLASPRQRASALRLAPPPVPHRSWTSRRQNMGLQSDDVLLRELRDRAELVQAEIVAFNWELSPDGDARPASAATRPLPAGISTREDEALTFCRTLDLTGSAS